ncbi:hypothetical protein BN1012_Phect3 [Candidatus Phaeomarinobacter ectocarpi]|uniref:Uncharacterized protein n=1 Tax=Candidatus Phaeomarinibacter ectocarpi TaxID=1458461 RepID=X5MBI8_9HYPH|nr:hypothetical protein BN1012_Phect3 [Candidatus Phaeomarinobacter ectocarpi]
MQTKAKMPPQREISQPQITVTWFRCMGAVTPPDLPFPARKYGKTQSHEDHD